MGQSRRSGIGSVIDSRIYISVISTPLKVKCTCRGQMYASFFPTYIFEDDRMSPVKPSVRWKSR